MGRTVDRILANIDLIEYMRNCGYSPYPMGNGSYYGLKEHRSVRIYPETNTYFHPGNSNGDHRRLNVINFAQWYYGISNQEAIKMLAKELNGDPVYKKSNVKREVSKIEKKTFELPEKTSGQYKHVYAYLTKTRCLSRKIVTNMIKRNFLYEDTHGNATFVGYHDGKASFCFQRGCSDKIPKGYKRAFTHIVEGSNFEYAFYVDNGSNRLFVTEAIIDGMSVMTMFEKHKINPNNYDYVSTCGTSMRPLVNYIKTHPNIDTVYLGFDNDDDGRKYRKRAVQELQKIGYNGKIIDSPPCTKDFNEDLKLLSQHNGTISYQQTLQNNNQIIERMIPR